MGDKKSILFVCSGNSARSILAEAIANQQFKNDLHAWSAGSDPKGEVNPGTLKILEENGLKAEGLRSKSWDEFAGRQFHLIVTLCDTARQEPCPSFPGNPPKVHWNLPDPAAPDQPSSLFEAVYEALVESIGLLVHAPDPSLAGRAREASRVLHRRFAPRAI